MVDYDRRESVVTMTRWNLDRGRRAISYELSNEFSGISAWLPATHPAASDVSVEALMSAHRTKLSWAQWLGVTDVFAAGWRKWGGPK